MRERRRSFHYLILTTLILVTSLGAGSPTLSVDRQTSSWESKVEANLLKSAQSGETEFLIYLKEQADLTAASQHTNKATRGKAVYQQLTGTAKHTQAPILAELKARGVEYRSFWIANLIWVRGDLDLLKRMANRADVAHLYANPKVRADIPQVGELESAAEMLAAAPTAVESNLIFVEADKVWAAGYTGQGVVIGGQDTGYDWDHPALKNQYRGWNGSTANHDYNWHDAIHVDLSGNGSNSCDFDSQAPCDDNYHGTHTMGIMVGDDGAGNQIGMAPGARWIGCRNMEETVGSPASYAECYQWFVAPTKIDETAPRPDLAPDIIDNSWACTYSEGCTEPDALLQVVENVRAAGILTVHSAGNDGWNGELNKPNCSSINTPAAIYDASFTVGNVYHADPDFIPQPDTIYPTSSRGPVSVDCSDRLKPDIVAPGYNINSSIPGDSYVPLTGTSMAAPHVAGEAALLLSAKPSLHGSVNLIEFIITSSAVHLETTEDCGGTAGQVPNNTFGWGRIDAWSAIHFELKAVYMPLIQQAYP